MRQPVTENDLKGMEAMAKRGGSLPAHLTLRLIDELRHQRQLNDYLLRMANRVRRGHVRIELDAALGQPDGGRG